ncbi:hypothetical protein Taro_043381, partial [Colocasia esculenta]|nr:hypothetical protein [Colocasia esculenta]
YAVVVLAGAFWWVSHNGALVALVEVLLGPTCVASTVLLAAVFSLMVRVVWLFRLCVLVKVLPRIAPYRFWQRFFPGVLGVCFRLPLCCPCDLKCAICVELHSGEVLPGRLLALLVEVLPRAALWLFWLWDFVCPRGRVVCFASRTPLPVGGLLCLEVLVDVWCAALSACMVGAVPCVVGF